MNIIRKLAACTTEEEVKAQYVRWLGIKGSIRNKVDFQSEGVLWEFKYLKNMQSSKQLATVMGQVTYYLRRQQRLQAGEQLPGLVVLADKNEAVVFQSQVLTPFFELSIDWRKAASSPDRELIKHLEPLAKQTRVFDMTNAVEAQAFADALKTADGSIVQRIVTIDNFEQAYVHWCELIGRHFAEADRGLAFMGDLTARATDTQYDVSTGVLQILQGQQRMQAHVPVQDYQKFWTIWHRPPAMADYQRMLAHVDRLRAIGDRRRTGAFFTPLPAGKLALEYIARELGEDWQDRYWVWDPACGSGNLTYYMDRYDRCFLSTIDQSDVDFVNQNGLAPEATVFQYDFCTDDVEKLAAGDAWISAGWKMPLALRWVLENEPDKLVILMNPPYAAATDGAGAGATKAGVSDTLAKRAFGDAGKARQELYTQFLLRSAHHRAAVIAVFSTLKLTNTDGYANVRQLLRRYQLRSGFCIHSAIFHGTKGNFPVGFQLFKETEDE